MEHYKTEAQGVPGVAEQGNLLWRTLCRVSILVLLISYLIIAIQNPYAEGEVASFELPIVSLSERMTFQLKEEDCEAACRLFPEHAETLRAQYQYLPTDSGGNKYPYYFGVYAPLCIIILRILQLFHWGTIHTLPLTNVLFFALSLWAVYRFSNISEKRKLFAIWFLGISPTVGYIHWKSYEVVMTAFVTIAAMFWLEGRRKPAAFFLSLAGTMNPTVMAFGLTMIAEYFCDIFCAAGKHPLQFIRKCLAEWKEIAAYAACFVPCLVPMAISYRAFGNLVSMSQSGTSQGLLERAAAYVLDLNFGFLPYIPVLMILFVVVCLKCVHCGQRKVFFALPGVVLVILAFSIHVHINSGMTGISRYGSWLLPIIILTVLFSFDKVLASRRAARGLLLVSFAWCAFVSILNLNTRYIDWLPIAETVMDYAPRFYNPLPSTFHSRTAHIDGGYDISEPVVYSAKDGFVRKVLVPPGMMNQCIQKLWIPEEEAGIFEKECEKVQSDGQPYYLNFRRGTHIRYCENYNLGEEIGFSETGPDAHRYFISGIYTTETDTVWTAGTEATFRLAVAEPIDEDLLLKIKLLRIYPPSRRMIVSCGETLLFNKEIGDCSEPVTIRIPRSCVQGGHLELGFHFPDAVSPQALGESDDARLLAFGLTSFVLESVSAGSSDGPYSVGSRCAFDGSMTDAHRYFTGGISETEDGFAWTDGNEAELKLRVADTDGMILLLDIARVFHAPQRMRISCAGQTLFEETIEGPCTVQAEIPGECIQDGLLELDFRFPDAVSPASVGESADARELAFAITGFSLVSQETHGRET